MQNRGEDMEREMSHFQWPGNVDEGIVGHWQGENKTSCLDKLGSRRQTLYNHNLSK